MSSVFQTLKAPVITEKGTLVAESNQIVFKVHPQATKTQIRSAVEELFEVKVSAVRTVNYMGKRKRYGRTMGTKPKWKKAYVTLADGNAADLLEKI
ncbi:MAG TPA: 50S ribosomal protein L23 [Candidatus Limnocylindrales bacterium]|nr:50S ribosomal protein L23 [Candidatus Limnocylindrales bacterium]